MFFDDTLQVLFGLLTRFAHLTADRKLVSGRENPSVVLGVRAFESSLGLGQHRIVGFGACFDCHHPSHRQIKTGLPANGLFITPGRLAQS